jgi:hypothetical protein
LEAHADFLLELIEKQPDLTLDEVVEAMRAVNRAGSRSAVARFYLRRKISFKKSLRASEQTRPDVARARLLWKRTQGLLNSARLLFIDETGYQYCHDQAARPLPEGPTDHRACPAWSLEDNDLRGGVALRCHRRPIGGGRSNERRDFPCLGRAASGAAVATGRHRDHGQSSRP